MTGEAFVRQQRSNLGLKVDCSQRSRKHQAQERQDGPFNFHIVKETISAVENVRPLSYFKFYPNPASDELNVVFQAYQAGHIQIAVHNQLGQEVHRQIKMIEVGDNRYTLNVRDLKDGFYFMTVIGPYNEKLVLKFIHR